MVIILKIFELKQSKLYKHYRLLNNKSKLSIKKNQVVKKMQIIQNNSLKIIYNIPRLFSIT